MMQGDQYRLQIHGSGFVIDDVAAVEFAVGDIVKMYPGQVTFDEDTSTFFVPLTQAETMCLPRVVPAQARVKLTTGEVIGAQIGHIDVLKSITRTVI